MAAPHVSGILALMKSYKNNLTTTEMIDTLYSTGHDNISATGVIATGKIANAYSALSALGSPPIDTSPPELLATIPTDASIDITLTSEIILTFDEPIKFSNTYNSDTSTQITINGLITSGTIVDTQLELQPAIPLEHSMTYTIFIPANIISDLNDNLLANDITFTFTFSLPCSPANVAHIAIWAIIDPKLGLFYFMDSDVYISHFI